MYLVAAESSATDLNLSVPSWVWLATGAVVMALLLFDLLVLHREAHVTTMKRAGIEVVCWTVVAVAFGVVVTTGFGGDAGGQWFAGYLIELSLSIDNVFVWALILSFFAVPRQYQHRVLFWGIFGAVILRAIFVFAGVALIDKFEWLLIAFGVFLLYTAYKLVTQDESHEIAPDANIALRILRKIVPSTTEYDGQKLFTRIDGKRFATPLLAVLVLVETTDVVFAVDSVPAVLAVSREQFIVLTSNAFAILGLRALYFLFADLHSKFEFLEYGLAIILAFVGIKMIIDRWLHIPTPGSLGFIVVVLGGAVALSIRQQRAKS